MDRTEKLELLYMLCDMQQVKRDDKRAVKIEELRTELGIEKAEKAQVWTEAHDLCQQSIDRINKMVAFSEDYQRRQDLCILRDLLADYLQDDELTSETVKSFNLYQVAPLMPKGFAG